MRTQILLPGKQSPVLQDVCHIFKCLPFSAVFCILLFHLHPFMLHSLSHKGSLEHKTLSLWLLSSLYPFDFISFYLWAGGGEEAHLRGEPLFPEAISSHLWGSSRINLKTSLHNHPSVFTWEATKSFITYDWVCPEHVLSYPSTVVHLKLELVPNEY